MPLLDFTSMQSKPFSPLILAAAMLWLAASALRSSANTTVSVTASNYEFTPAKVVAHVGDPTTLHLTSSAGMHGIMSKDLGIPQTVIVPGKAVDVTFTPAKPGTYKVPCSVICGPGHAGMVLTVDAQP
jgi:cytochrome c oxidase subunit 2